MIYDSPNGAPIPKFPVPRVPKMKGNGDWPGFDIPANNETIYYS